MTNNKQQTAVEWFWNKIDYLIPFVSDEHAKYLHSLKEQAKEMEKERMIKFCIDWFISREMNIKEYYEQTYGGGEK